VARIYTRSGDNGQTGLSGGNRVSKADARIQVIGEVDETNAAIGLARCALTGDSLRDLDSVLEWTQNRLFDLGAALAGAQTDAFQEGEERIELEIDRLEAELQPLRNFVLPGGCEAAARLHVARTLCRRAERSLVGLDSAVGRKYLNRLSDLLFVMARTANRRLGVSDVKWSKETNR
jgi:cob(I)alamin adenosyltransferase